MYGLCTAQTSSTRQKFLLLVLSLCLFPALLQAAHIIGGEINYQCLGNDNYRFRMILYRDCSGNGALFDGDLNAPLLATITIYRGNSATPYAIVDPGAPTITHIPPDLSNPCLVAPPGVCVEEGIYTFTLNLPYTGESYHIVYQRCCRNNTISNILNPGNTGATYYMELTPLAQQVCNNSPTFDNFPPIVICRNEPINFDFSATDADGDQLIYSFCTPYRGGGPDTDNTEAPFGVAPNPDLPPPFYGLTFLNPYSVQNPLGTNPPMTIDPTTGIIDGIPPFLGQFVVGVCVEEYRNGQLLSTTRRDFQFNVANCEPTVVAQIQSDDIKPDGTFVVQSCGSRDVQFVNQSFQANFIYETFWSFDLGGGQQFTSDEWSPLITFPEEGIFQGYLILNPGTTCSDSIGIELNIFPAIYADFTYQQIDPCTPDSIYFTDLSFSNAGANALIDWAWDFGDGQSSNQVHPAHYYDQPGDMQITLTVTDINNCSASTSQILPYYPLPPLIIPAPNTEIGCEPLSVHFLNLSQPINESYEILWEFGDGNTGFGVSPTHLYEQDGIYTLYLSITSPLGCFIDSTFIDLIEVLPSPTAGFDYTPSNPSNFEPLVQFTDQSQDAASWYWNFGGWGESYVPNPLFEFPDTGKQVVTQIVTHLSGCQDTLSRIVDIEPQVRYFLPNAFTPNADGTNDGFRGAGIMDGAREFTLQIWDRYGALIFETHDPNTPWRGYGPKGQMIPPGTYLVTVRYVEPRGKEVKLKGTVTLIR